MITKIFWQLLKWVKTGARPRWDKDDEDAYDLDWMETIANWWPPWRTKKKPALRSKPSRYPWMKMWKKTKKKEPGQKPLTFRYSRDHVLVKRREGGPWVKP
jgi:hypothetical protein